MGLFTDMVYENVNVINESIEEDGVLNTDDGDVTIDDIVELLEYYDADTEMLNDVYDYILDEYEEDEEEDDDEYEDEDDEYEEDEMNEAIKKRSKSSRNIDARKQRRRLKKTTVKRDLKKRRAKKCSSGQRVKKVGKGVYKCVAKTNRDRKKSKRLKKFKRLYKNG